MATCQNMKPLLILLTAAAIYPQHLNFLLYKGKIDVAISHYRAAYEEKGKHDPALLEQLALGILERGIKVDDDDVKLLTLFGAGVSFHEKTLSILNVGLSHPHPRLQLVSLHFLTQFGDQTAQKMVEKAASSGDPLLQLEAIHSLILMEHPAAHGRLTSFMAKTPREIRPLYPSLFTKMKGKRAALSLRQFLTDPNIDVRVEAILGAARRGQDELLPEIRALSKHINSQEQEAACQALAELSDGESLPRLKELSSSSRKNVSLSATSALYNLGDKEALPTFFNLAKEGYPFAIAALGKVEESDDLLKMLSTSQDLSIQLNTTLSLLERESELAIPLLKEILYLDPREIVFEEAFSPGKAFSAWRPLHLSKWRGERLEWAKERSRLFREELVWKASSLSNFSELAEFLLRSGPRDLVPTVTSALRQIGGRKETKLLQTYTEKVGDPLVRNWCALQLYQMGQLDYGKQVRNWVLKEGGTPLIELRPLLPKKMALKERGPRLSPEEKSRLLVESLETISNAREKEGIDTLLELMQNGNPKNRYALAGLLLQAIR